LVQRINDEVKSTVVAIEGVIDRVEGDGVDDYVVTDNKERYLLDDSSRYYAETPSASTKITDVCNIGDRCLIHARMSPYDTKISEVISVQNLNAVKIRNKH
ncbi:MAG: hypothetical protein LBG66_05085, partial [Gallionellaceae bacterium]|nr:hypothetical protein [Gallionellaceae bacterium]